MQCMSLFMARHVICRNAAIRSQSGTSGRPAYVENMKRVTQKGPRQETGANARTFAIVSNKVPRGNRPLNAPTVL